MRISSHQMLSTGVASMQRHASDAIDYQQQISSGNKYSKASQNATALARGVEIQFDKSRYEMLKKNQDFISTRMALADTQLGSIHDVLVSMQEVAVRARGPALGVPGLTAVAQQARQNYEHLQNLAVAMDSNDDRYLLRMTSEARLLAPKSIVYSGSSSLTSATIASDAVFRRSGDYVIQGTADPQEMRMQIRGADGVLRGPDGTEGSYFTGDISGMGTEDSPFTLSFRQELNGRFTHTETDANGSIVERYTYPRQPDAFLNLDITLDALPTSDTQIEFSPLAVTVDLDRSARIYTSGDFSVRLTFDGSNYGAELWANDEFIKSVDLGESIGLEGESTTLALNFGDHESLPAFFNDLTLTLIGDPTKLSWGEPSTFNAETTTWSLPLVDDADAMTFRVEENVKRIEIEPGVWVPEGISFREAFGNAYDFNAERSRDVLRDALLFVESLERSAKAGALESGFIDRQNDIIQSTDQIMQYRMRAGAIDAQNDLAKAALETKATELEAHKGRLLDTDVAEASAGLVRAQSLLEAARSIFSRLESSNLFNRLG
jgi:flagellin-like hook-associated protein FlgL